MKQKLSEIELFKGKGSKFYYRPIALNGEQVYESQGYATKWNAKRAALKVWPDEADKIVDLDGADD